MITANRILKTGEQRSGKILEVWDTNVTINNNPQVGMLVEVKDKYGKTYQTKYKKQKVSLADASLVRMLELVKGGIILTTDSDFEVYRIHRNQRISVIHPN